MSFKEYSLRLFLLPVLWGFIVLFLSAIPGNNLQEVSLLNFNHADKVAHFIMYFVFSFLLIYGFQGSGRNNQFITYFYAAGIAIAYGILMEIMQHYIFTNRHGNIYDILANSAGAVSAVFTFNPVMKLLVRTKKNIQVK